MNFKRNILSWFLVFLMVFSFSAGSFSTASAEQVERYKVTGTLDYKIHNALNLDLICDTFEIKNGIMIKSNDTITFTYSHVSPENPSDYNNLGDVTNFELVYKQLSNLKWIPVSINGYPFSNNTYPPVDDPTKTTFIMAYFIERENNIYHEFSMGSIDLAITPISDAEGIAPGTYQGTGSASVQTAFGNFNLGTLAKTKIKATVTSSNLQLAFQAKNIPYHVTADFISIDNNGVSTYKYQNDSEIWNITAAPDGKLNGTLTYLGDKGIMDFSIQLQTN